MEQLRKNQLVYYGGGESPASILRQQAGDDLVSGYVIVFAEAYLQIQADVDWPVWVMDRPSQGLIIGKGQPICSIIAAANDALNCLAQLKSRKRFIENLLNIGLYTHGISG